MTDLAGGARKLLGAAGKAGKGAFRTTYVYIPPANDSDLAAELGPAMLDVADRIAEEVREQTQDWERRRPFAEQLEVAEGPEPGGAQVGTDWSLAHLWEWGSAQTPTEAPMRTAAENVAREVGRYEP